MKGCCRMQEAQFRNKVNWISIICAILVVFLHSYSFGEGTQDLFAYHLEFFISRNIAQASVPTFFALSAFLFYRNFSYSKLGAKYFSRLKTLVLPYLIWNAISMVIFYFLSKLPFINTEAFEFTLHNLLDGLVYYEYNLVFWFVFQLIILTYCFPLFYPLLKKKFVALAVFAFLLYYYGSGNPHFWRVEIKAVIFYLFGAYFAVHHQESVVNNRKISVAAVAAFILSQILIYSKYAEEPIVYITVRLLMIVWVFCFSNLLKDVKLPALLNCSFPIYAMHNIILEFFNKVFSFLLSVESNLILIDYIGSTVMTVAIIAAFNYILLKKLPGIHGVLFGGRGK